VEEGQLSFDLKEGPELNVEAEREDFLNAYVPGPDGKITLTSPDLTMDGTYRLNIEIMGWDSIDNLFSPGYSIGSSFDWDELDVPDKKVTVPEFSEAGIIISVTLGAIVYIAKVRKQITSYRATMIPT
jgi:hypothetical protein